MTALPLRPALPDVLAGLTDTDTSLWRHFRDLRATGAGVSATNGDHSPTGMFAWTTRDPAEALEVLIVRGVLPQSFADDPRRAFLKRYKIELDWCDTPNTGSTTTAVLAPHPPTIPDLVAWASLGASAIQQAEELARETVWRLRPWGAPQPERVVWWVGPVGGVPGHVDGRPLPSGWPLDANEHKGTLDPDDPLGTKGTQDVFDAVMAHCKTPGAWWYAHAVLWKEPQPCPHDPAYKLFATGLAIDSITADAVTLVVPPVGAP